MWLQGDEAVFVFMGDCMALVRSGSEVRLIGHAEKVEDETAAARRVMALTPEERMGWLRQSRRLSNEVGGVFGLGPAVAGNLQIQRATVKPGHEACLVSDGLYRLISPYATHTLETSTTRCVGNRISRTGRMRKWPSPRNSPLRPPLSSNGPTT